jgi:teichuronic acid biosynthesis glycosyltransferase TuaC
LLTFSSLYPNFAQPRHGIFVEQRLRQLLKSGEVQVDVMAPVPWFPFAGERFGQYAIFAQVPESEHRHEIQISHPRYVTIPKVGMTVAPVLMALSAAIALRRMIRSGLQFDLIDAHYFYPDGVAAIMLGKIFNKPVVITARGTDINLIPEYALPRGMIRWAADRANAVVSVSQALKARILELGVDAQQVTVLRNGVDLEHFAPEDKAEARRLCGGWSGTWLLSVGNLIELKGHHLIIEALTRLPGVHLAIVGEGPNAAALRRLAEKLQVSDRVRFVGTLDQTALRHYYCAADALVLASSREGMANVLLEATACGLPVVATPISGTPEVISAPAAGVLTADRSASAIVAAVENLLAAYPDRGETRAHAEQFGWNETTQGQLALFRRILAEV